jgi:hypothetical protein
MLLSQANNAKSSEFRGFGASRLAVMCKKGTQNKPSCMDGKKRYSILPVRFVSGEPDQFIATT